MLFEPSRALLERWFPGAPPLVVHRLADGYVNDLFRLDTARGPVVLKVSQASTSMAAMLCAQGWLTHIASRLPEVPAPLATPDGSTVVMDGGRATTLLPFIDGDRPSRFRREHRIAAAHTLARIHVAAATIPDPPPRPGQPAWHHLDWRRNDGWDWDHLRAILPGAADAPAHVVPAVLADTLDRHIAVLPFAIKELAHRRWVTHPLHGDYWEGNLKVSDDRVVGVFDWDEARLDWRAWEVADAAWSFSVHVAHDDFDREHAREFVAAYCDAGGAVTPGERAVLVLLMRARRLWEALHGLGHWSAGDELDWDSVAASARALDVLDGIDSLDDAR